MRYITLLLLVGGGFLAQSCTVAQPGLPKQHPPAYHQTAQDQIHNTGSANMGRLEPGESLSLEVAVRAALLNNPDLRAKYAAFEAALYEAPQASSLADPRISYTQFVEGVQTRTGEQEFAAGITQMFPWYGKRRLMGEIAHTRAMQALEDYRVGLLDVREKVQLAWYRLSYEKAAFGLAQEDRDTVARTLNASSSLYAAGQSDRGVLLQSQTELARLENELAGYPARIAAYEVELRRLLFVDEMGDVPALVYPGEAPDKHDEAGLLEAATAQRPELERLRLEIERAELRHRLAEKEYYPDFSVGLNYVGVGDRPDDPMGAMAPSDEGDDAWGVTFGINIPLPNARRAAAKAQARKEGKAATWQTKALEADIAQEIASLLPRLASLEEQLTILETNLLPLAEEAFAANEAAYTSGRATFLDLLNAQRTLIAVRKDLLRTWRDYLISTAELERAVGNMPTPDDGRKNDEDE